LTDENKKLVGRFIEAINRHDYGAMERLLHPEFRWVTAVVSDDGPNEMRKMQSDTLKGKNLHHAKPRLNRAESLDVYHRMFAGDYRNSMASDATVSDESSAPVHDPKYRLQMDILGLTAEEDRVAMEAQSYLLNAANGRVYNNFYHYLFRVKDGQIVLFKEYQDTLHLFDYLAE
jgi:ketosteroid isomerase-like protein